jgi:hypothetical protein
MLSALVIGLVFVGACANSPVASQPGAIAVGAEELYSTYEQDEAAADAKYSGNLLEVTGTITSIRKDTLPVTYIVLDGGGKYDLLGVECLFDEEHELKLGELKQGQTVVVLGTCDGYALDVMLQDCTLIR